MRYLWIVLLLVSPVLAIEEVAPVLSWPLPMPSEAQLEEARNCDFTVNDIEEFEPQSACEWMALAMALAGEGGSVPEDSLSAFRQAVRMNPALPLHFDVLAVFWNRLGDTIPAPEFASQAIREVEIFYDFASTTSYELSIQLENDAYVANAEVFHAPYADDSEEYSLEDEAVDTELIRALALGLTDLVPIEHTYTDQPCWHIISDWTVNLVFEDGTEISIKTYESNVLEAGGFWQTTIDEQSYLQVSPAFLLAVVEIHEALEMPWGEVASYGCGESQAPLEAGF
jgi:hypothetical protein